MTKCPHCQTKLFHEKMDAPHHTPKGLVDQYRFKCSCMTFPTLGETLFGYTKSVDHAGNLIHIEVITDKFSVISVFQPTQQHGLNFRLGTIIYAMKHYTVQNSSIRYRVQELVLRLPEIKDLSNPNMKELDNWCATMVIFA